MTLPFLSALLYDRQAGLQTGGRAVLLLLIAAVCWGATSPAHAQSSKALVLDGLDDAVVLDEESAFDFGDGFTVSFWVTVEGGFSTPSVPIVAKGNDAWQIRRSESSNRLAFVTGHTGGASRDTLDGRTLLNDGEWHHVAIAYDPVEREKTMYVDGRREGSSTLDAALQTNDDSVRIGTSTDRPDAHFGGQIDDLRFWSTARSRAEIRHALWHPLEGTEANLRAYYPANTLESASGTTVLPDRGPNDIRGVVKGGAPLADAPVPRPRQSIQASDGIYENRTKITWPTPSTFVPSSALLRVVRDESLLSYRSADDSTYTDETSDSDTTYTYCLEVETALNTYTYDCDTGARSFEAAANVDATDETYTDRIEVTWNDRSSVEAGYRLYRDGTQIAELDANAQRYVDSTEVLEPRTDVEYCVAPYDANGEGEQVCDTGRIGEVVPATNVTATSGEYDDRVVLDWDDPTSGTTGFTITRGGVEIAEIRSPLSTTYRDTTVTPGQEYEYCVIRQEGAIESTPLCTDGSAGTLAAPTAVSATDSTFDDRVDLEWRDQAEVESEYLVYRQEGDQTDAPDSTAMTQIATLSPDAASYTDPDATPGRLYTYCVVAATDEGARTILSGTDPVGRSVDACDLGARDLVLAPTEVAATDSTAEDRVTITWSDPATRSSLYRVYRRRIGTNTVTPIATLPTTKTEYVDETARPNTRHEYCVTSLTEQGSESDRSCDFGSREVLAPEGVTATDDEFEDRVRVEWTDASAQEVGYRIYRRPLAEDGSPVGSDSTRLHTTVRNEIVLLDTTGTPGRDYRYSVETLVQFDGDTLATSAGTDTGRRTLEPPTRVNATDGAFEQYVKVTWRDNSGAEDGYRIWRVSPAGDTTLAGETADNVTSFNDEDAMLEKQYTYLVAAFDSHGTSDRGRDEGLAEILPPGSVNASDSYANKITISWVDRSDREAGYQILKDGTVLQTTGPNTTTYTDSGLGGDSSARYCIKSMSQAAGMSTRVCDRGEVTGTTPNTEGREVTLQEIIATGTYPTGLFGYDLAASVSGETPTVFIGEPQFGLLDLFGRPRGSVVALSREDGSWSQEDVERLRGDQLGLGMDFGPELPVAASVSEFSRYEPESDSWKATDPNGGESGEVFIATAADSIGTVVAWNDTTGKDVVRFYSTEADTIETVATDSTFFRRRNITSEDMPGDVDFAERTVAIGEVAQNRVSLHTRNENTNNWNAADSVSAADLGVSGVNDFGESIALTKNQLFVGVPDQSRVYVYDVDAGDIGSNPQVLSGGSSFGSEVEVNTGGTLLVGAPRINRAVLLQRQSGGGYERTFVFRPGRGSERFGSALDIAGGQVFVGAPGQYTDQGAVYYFEVVAAPTSVTASDGTQNDRVDLEWQDRSEEEDGYRVYRNGTEIATLGSNTTTYKDEDADPGDVSQYCVSAFNSDLGFETQLICDQGWRAPDGAIAGQVQQQDGTGFKGVDVCLTPDPNSALLLDGEGGHAITDDLAPNVPDAFTLEAWVRPEAKSNGNAAAAWAFNTGDGTDRGKLTYDDGRFRYVEDVNATSTTSTFSVNEWHHVAITVDASDNGTMYVDGTQEATFVVDTRPDEGTIFTLGQDRSNRTNSRSFWKGQLDEVRLWSTVRTPTQIDSLRDRSLTGQEDSLMAYWPLDERGGQAAANVVSDEGKYYADYRGGIAPAEEGAPLDACVRTDADGNYTHRELRYGDGIEFTVDPELEPHTFQPGRSTVTINANTPVQNQVTFTDQTDIPVSGTVNYAGTECPVRNVEIDVDGSTEGSTDSNGAYNVGVLPGPHTIVPTLSSDATSGTHSFSPEQKEVDVTEETTGVNFEDTTTRTLTVDAHGGCDFSVGIAEVKIRSTNGCYENTVETDSTGILKTDLPPQEYTVQVTGVRDVPDPQQKGAIERFFDQQGAYTVDLAESADTTLELVYRAPITAKVEQWPDPAGCGNVDVPVLERNEELDLDLKVVEDYGNGNLCPADSAKVTVYDELPDKGDEPKVAYTDSTGRVDYHTFARTPNLIEGRIVNGVDRSYQKSLTMIAEAGIRRDETTRWAIAEGKRPRKGTRFVTDPIDFPISVLRDPPGDGSFSYLEEGTELCTSASFASGLETTLSVSATAGATVEAEVGWWGYYQDIKFAAQRTQGISVTTGVQAGGGFSTCATTNERISTGGDGTAVGRPADVFLGAGINFVFSTSDVLQVEGENAATCDITRSQTTSFRPDSISTTYAYTRGHIEGTMLPTLRELKETSDEDRFDYDASIRQWEHILYQSDSLASEAEPITNDDNESISLDKNVSFSGGADYEYSESRAHTANQSVSTYSSFTAFIQRTVGTIEPVTLQLSVGQQITTSVSSSTTREEGDDTLWGFSLSDGEGGDNFTVNVKKDPVYGTPVFDVRSGLSSCPYEPWREPYDDFTSFQQDRTDWKEHEGELLTTRRDKARLRVNGAPTQTGVPPDEKATFGATLINDSPSDETRKYELRMLNESNPKGAIVRVNGASLSSGRPFTVEPGTASNLTVTVERGVEAFEYDSLGVMTYAPCGFFPQARSPTLDTMYVSVEFDPPSSPIALRSPDDGFALNRVTTDDSIDVRLKNFSMDTTDTGHSVSEVGVFIRPATDLSGDLRANSKAAAADSAKGTRLDSSRTGRFFKGAQAKTLFRRLQDSAAPKASRGIGALEDWEDVLVRAGRDEILSTFDCADENCDLEDITTYFKKALVDRRDGVYELAAYTKTTNPDGTVTGAYVHDPIRIAVDTKRPRVHGTPEPADGLLTPGDDVAVTFDEDVDCSTLRPNDNVTLSYADSTASIPLRPTCDGRVVYLRPTETDALEAANGHTLVATVETDTTGDGAVQRDAQGPTSLTDPAGNPLATDAQWRFSVQQRTLAWTPPADTLTLTRGATAQLTADLVNYRGDPVTYALDGPSETLSVDGPTRAPAPLSPGDGRTVQMTADAVRAPGTYTDTLWAVGAGDRPVPFVLHRIVEAPDDGVGSASNVRASVVGDRVVKVQWASADSTVARYDLYRSTTPTPDTTTAPLTTVSARTTQYVDTTAHVGRTHYYRLKGRTSDGRSSALSKASEAFLYPDEMIVETQRTFADGRDPSDFRLVALPGQVDQSLAAAVPGTPGDDWSAYWDTGASENPFTSAQDDGTLPLRPGRGYWLRHKHDAWSVNTRLKTVALRGDTTTAINLHEGWNIISNPLDKDVAWSTVAAANNTSLQALWRFTGHYEQMRTFPSARTGEAFYFLNHQNLDSLVVPYPGAPFEQPDSAQTRSTTKAASSPTNASLSLVTYQNGVYTSQATVAIDRRAEAKRDDGDQFAPPSRFEGARLRIEPPFSTPEPRRQLLAREARPPASQGQKVQLVLEATPGSQVRLEARRVRALDAPAVRLVNRSTGRSYDLRRRQAMDVTARGEQTAFVLLFGSQSYVEEAWSNIVPPTATLRPNYPNPFRTQTTIEYAVPEAAAVRLSVYDVLGRRVATLVDGRRDAGWHRVKWNAGANGGASVASGIYFGRLRVNGEVYTQKMVVVQ